MELINMKTQGKENIIPRLRQYSEKIREAWPFSKGCQRYNFYKRKAKNKHKE